MELIQFALNAILGTLLFTGIRLAIELPSYRIRWLALISLSIACLGLFIWIVQLLDDSVLMAWGRLAIDFPGRASDIPGHFPRLGNTPYVLAMLRDGIGIYVVLGLVQGVVFALAISAISAAPGWRRYPAWRRSLLLLAPALSIPTALAMLMALYNDNRQRISEVQFGSYLRLALSPAASSASQQSGPSGPSETRLFPTSSYFDSARASLNGDLRRRDLQLIGGLHRLAPHIRIPDHTDLTGILARESWHRDWVTSMCNYIHRFDDYNLFTLEIGKPLVLLQTAWEIDAQEIQTWLGIIRDLSIQPDRQLPIDRYRRVFTDSDSLYIAASNIASEAAHRNRSAQIRLGAKPDINCEPMGPPDSSRNLAGSSVTNVSSEPDTAQPLGPLPPPTQGSGGLQTPPSADAIRRRIVGLHAPYQIIGIANVYAAIGSFETSYILLRRWIQIDAELRGTSKELNEYIPEWFTLRTKIEAASIYKAIAPDARLRDRYWKQMDEIVQHYRRLVPQLPTGRRIGNSPCAGMLMPRAEASELGLPMDPVAALLLGRATSEVEYFEVRGLSGGGSQKEEIEARAIADLDFNCFEGAFAPGGDRQRVLASLHAYKSQAVVAWGRLAVRWAEAGRSLRRVSEDERRKILAEVRTRVGAATETLERLAQDEEDGRNRRADGGITLSGDPMADLARNGRRVLQEVTALDR